jgi:hypothetical protein
MINSRGATPVDARSRPGLHRPASREDLPAEFDIASRGRFATGALEGIGGETADDIVSEPEQLQVGGGMELGPALELRRTLGMLATGVTVITTQVAGEAHR